jgi:protein phosphatase
MQTARLRLGNAMAMRKAIEGYCWTVNGVEQYKIAPFHLLAAEGQVFADRTHAWHMETLSRLVDFEPIVQATKWMEIAPSDEADRAKLIDWWIAHTERGGEGIVVKPLDFIAKGEKGLIQPAIKVRGRDYLRIIYGPDYDMPDNIERLRQRGLARKWSLAQREFELGIEALERFVARRPLAHVHECVLAVLALESEPVDPRL